MSGVSTLRDTVAIVLSVGTITAGSGYKYLTEEVVTGAEDYYLRGVDELGERAGRWVGSGPGLLGLEGVVQPEQMALMYGQGMHPEATPDNPAALGPVFPRYKTVPERLLEARAVNPDANAEEWEQIEQKIRKGGERSAVAGFDLTFSPPKSWSVLWAAAPNEEALQHWVRRTDCVLPMPCTWQRPRPRGRIASSPTTPRTSRGQ
jgi:hypothetical protein